jgi:hypothetical protein
MKYYKVPESHLIELISDSIKLSILEADGVDNWIGYMESRKELITEAYGEDIDFKEAAIRDLKFYEEIKGE